MIKFKSLNEYDEVWFTSDSHYSHSNICRGTTRWDLNDHGGDNSVRDFGTLQDMNDAIIKGINDHVEEHHVLIHAGDVAFGGADKVLEFCERVNCKNIILTPGNHDKGIRDQGRHRGYFENVLPINDLQYVQFKGVKMVVSHFPMLVWHQSHKDSRLVFGHVHGSNPGVGKSMDVGIDNIYKTAKEYKPISFKEFESFTDGREAYLESHHNSKTS